MPGQETSTRNAAARIERMNTFILELHSVENRRCAKCKMQDSQTSVAPPWAAFRQGGSLSPRRSPPTAGQNGRSYEVSRRAQTHQRVARPTKAARGAVCAEEVSAGGCSRVGPHLPAIRRIEQGRQHPARV